MSKIAQPHFSYDYSKFCVGRGKEQTARVAVWKEMNCQQPNIFTMESSFCGPKPVKYEPHRGNKKAPTLQEMNYHFNTEDYSTIGQRLCETLLLYRSEKESSMGLLNVEYQIQQYHLDKEAKLEQENLIKQQQVLTQQRQMAEMQSRMKGGNTTNFFSEFENAQKATTSAKKTVRKVKTEQLTDANGNEKRKVNYNLKDTNDDSDGASDS